MWLWVSLTPYGSFSIIRLTTRYEVANHKVLNYKGISTRFLGFPGGSVVKNLPAVQEVGDESWVPLSGRSPSRRKWQPTPVFLPGESHRQRSLVGYRVAKSQIGPSIHHQISTSAVGFVIRIVPFVATSSQVLFSAQKFPGASYRAVTTSGQLQRNWFELGGWTLFTHSVPMNIFRLKEQTVQKSNSLIFPKGKDKQMALVKEVSDMAFLYSCCILHVEQMLFWRMKRHQDNQTRQNYG